MIGCALWGKDIATHGYSVLQQCAATGTAQMRIGTLRRNTTARGSGNESFLQEVGLVDVTNGVGFLSDRRSKGLDSDRTAVELVDYRCQNRAIHLVKATRIDL